MIYFYLKLKCLLEKQKQLESAKSTLNQELTKASIKIIQGKSQLEAAKKELDKQDKAKEEAQKEKEGQSAVIKPDSIKPIDIIQKKKEVPTVEVKQERVEAPQAQFAPIPVTSAPVGQ